MAVITISRQAGSLGDTIAGAVADRLGYELVGKEQISRSLAEHGFTPAEVNRYDEKNPSLLQHLSPLTPVFDHLIRACVYELAGGDNVVLVGRGAHVILQDIPGTLKVRIIAPYETRLQRCMEEKGGGPNDSRFLIDRSDRDSSGYIHTYFNVDWDDSELYDMVLNTRTMPVDTCVSVICAALGSDAFRRGAEVGGNLADLALTRRVRAALLEIDEINEAELVVRNGRLRLPEADRLGSPGVEGTIREALAAIPGLSLDN